MQNLELEGRHESMECVLSSFSHVWLFVTPWTIAHQDLMSMGFSRWEYWRGLPYLHPGDLPYPGIKPMSLMSPASNPSLLCLLHWQVGSLPLVLPGKPLRSWHQDVKPVRQELMMSVFQFKHPLGSSARDPQTRSGPLLYPVTPQWAFPGKALITPAIHYLSNDHLLC